MSPLRKSVELEMRLRGFSPRTHQSYIHALEELARFYWRPLDTLSCAEVQVFLDHLISERKLAWSTINVYFSACRFLYEQILKRPVKDFSIPRRSRTRRRPGVLSPQEVVRVLDAPRLLKHRALLAMTFGSGLRVSEVVNIQPRHIDRGRMMLFVTGKGHKDRYTVLSADALNLLGHHWRANGSFDYFFYGHDKSRPMAVASAQAVYYQALKRSGVRHVGGIHVLRHCFATFLIEAGWDIHVIKRWMGHTAVVTTGRYFHMRAEHLRTIQSPLDAIKAEA